MGQYGGVERSAVGRRVVLGGDLEQTRVGPVRVGWSPGGLRYWVHNQFFRRDGLESLAQVNPGDHWLVHASEWGSRRALCGRDDVDLRRLKMQWGDECPERYFREAGRLNARSRRCPSCLELEPVDTTS